MKKKRVFSLLLCACMVLMLLPAVAITASAAETSAMTLGTDGISAGDEVYFGNYTESGTAYNVPWVVVGSDGSIKTTLGTSPTSLFLLSKYMLGDSAFQSSGSGSYSGSILQGNMDTNPSSLYNTMFTALEKGAVNSTDLSDVSVTGAHLFPLSFAEFSTIHAGIGVENITGLFWWLRFAAGASPNQASYVIGAGALSTSRVTDAHGVRPAFNLNLNSVLFASAAEGGKSSGAPGAAALNPVPAATPAEWKLTLLDSSRSSFAIGTTAINGKVLSIGYSGATVCDAVTAPNEYISAIIEDSSGNIQYYGRIAQPTSSSGTVDVDLSSVTMDEGDKLYVFSEQYNGDKKTDYASELKQVSMTENAYPVTYTLADLMTNGVSYVSNDNTTDYTATLSADSGYLLPASISVTVGGTAATLAASAADADTAGEYYYDVTTGAVKVAAVTSAVGITATGVPKISTWPAIIDFGSLTEGYITLPDTKTVTITNNEDNPVGGYSVTGNSTDFNVSYTSAAIAANGTSTFTVKPVAGLAPGTHTAELTITTSEGNTATVNLSFTVNAKSPSSTVTCYTITATADDGGSISPSGSTTVAYGSGKTYVITASNGYEIKDVLVDGVSVGAVTTYNFSDVSKSHTIKAVFQKKITVWQNPYSDIQKGVWCYNAVRFVSENGLMNGTTSDTFSPNGGMTRGMFVAVLYRLSGDTGSYTSSFADVPSGKWYENAVAWATQNGIAGGVGNNRFAPNSGITRQQLAVLLYNYAKYKGYDVSIGEDTNILSYEDAFSISDYAYPALQWACGAGIMDGNNKYLNPNRLATRAQVAAILERFAENVAK